LNKSCVALMGSFNQRSTARATPQRGRVLRPGARPLPSDMPNYCWMLAATWLGLWSGCLQLRAESSPFSIAQWTSDTISPQNAVLTVVISITQTRDGYLWLGTPDGLLRFDGARFTSFNEANTPGLTSGAVVKLFEDSRTNLWI